MFLFLYFLKSNYSVPSVLPQQTNKDTASFCFLRPDFHFHHPAAIFCHTHCRQEKRISVGAVLPPSKAGAAGRLSSRRGWGCWLIHKKKRRIFLTVPGKQNYAALSSLSDERSRRKSLREEFWLRWQNFASPGQLEIPRF